MPQGDNVNERGRDIKSLVGEQLSAVSFVQDYVELHFEGPVIRAINNPIATINEQLFKFPDIGSRDALCSFISQKVTQVYYKEHVELTILFSNGGKISVPLDDDSYRSPESVHWCPDDGPMEVWQ